MSLEGNNVDVKEMFPDNFVKGKRSFHCNASVFSDVADFLSGIDSDLKYERVEKLFCKWYSKRGYMASNLSFAFSYVGNTDYRSVFSTEVLIAPSRSVPRLIPRSIDTTNCFMTYVSEYTMSFKTGLYGFLFIPDGLNKILPDYLVSSIGTIKGVLKRALFNSTSINVLISLWVKDTPFVKKRLSPYNVPSNDLFRVLLNILQSNFNELFEERGISEGYIECSHTTMYFNRAYVWYKGGL